MPTLHSVVGARPLGVHVQHARRELAVKPGGLVVGNEALQLHTLLRQWVDLKRHERHQYESQREEGDGHQLREEGDGHQLPDEAAMCHN